MTCVKWVMDMVMATATTMGWRRFTSPAEEEIACLEHYLDEMKKEMAGVEARLKELRG